MLQPTIILDSAGATLEYESEATWPKVRLKWTDYPDAFIRFLRALTVDINGISRVDISSLKASRY